jgi:hypothetical protein
MQLDRFAPGMARSAMNDAWGESTRLSFDELCRAVLTRG